MPPKPDCCITLVANNAMLPGLCAALGSLARSGFWTGQRRIPCIVFFQDISATKRQRLLAALRRLCPEINLEFREADISPYAGLRPLHGDLMTYVRLGLPRLLPEYDRILYVDSDMIFGRGIMDLLEVDLGGRLFAAGSVGPIAHALEHAFYSEIGIPPGALSFNAGLLVIDARKWSTEHVERAAIEFGLRHRDRCQSADQTILNALFHARFLPLPPTYNEYCGPWTAPAQDSVVRHFVGMPKPWDLFGRWLHQSHQIWFDAACAGAYREVCSWPETTRTALGRAWVARRSLARAMIQRLKWARSSPRPPAG